MPKTPVVTGSIAFDRIAVFQDEFQRHILPDKVHNLNVCFKVHDMDIHYGGTGANIAYNLAQLGMKPYLLGMLGSDGDDYLKYLKKKGIDTTYVRKSDHDVTASCHITTDLKDNQITSFCIGAMALAHSIKLKELKVRPKLVHIGPNDKQAMIQYAEYCFRKNIPFVADPGQDITVFDKKEAKNFIAGAYIFVVNDYELSLFQHKTGFSQEKILRKVKYLIVTLGGKGSKIYSQGKKTIHVPAYKGAKVVDPTGCGDAYRSGLLYGHAKDMDIIKSAHIGAWMAARCIEHRGTQKHRITKQRFNEFLKSLK